MFGTGWLWLENKTKEYGERWVFGFVDEKEEVGCCWAEGGACGDGLQDKYRREADSA
jgi:hypothetical protein